MNWKTRVPALVSAAAIVVAGIGVAVIETEDRLAPGGRARVTLEGDGARWNSFVQVYEGSFSAQLSAGAVDPDDTAKVTISPLNVPLSRLSESGITFWAYFETANSAAGQHLWVPHVELVLDNGRWLSGDQNTRPVGAAKDDAAFTDEATQGYPSASLWTKMQVQGCGGAEPDFGNQCGFYSDFAATDPEIPDDRDINGPVNLADWALTFPTARVVQIRIANGGAADADDHTVYVDSLRVSNRLIRLDPETAATGGP